MKYLYPAAIAALLVLLAGVVVVAHYNEAQCKGKGGIVVSGHCLRSDVVIK